MADQQLETDYLVVGSGAVGMAFVDTLLSETDAHIALVDRNQKPGGHWNQAYPFVTLHQPSAFYGVSSRELSSGCKDEVGLNRGLNELASGAEVSAYFDDVMRQRFLPSGRVSYHPMCDYVGDFKGDYRFRSRLTGEHCRVRVNRRVVDATWLNTTVPLTHTPSFSVAAGVRFMPPNHLPGIVEAPDGFVVIGGGKTGIDTCLWLLENGVNPDSIQWIVSRDGWLLDRRNTQPTPEFFHDAIGSQAAQYEAIAGAESIDELFERLEAVGYFLRLDTGVRPTMFHGATVSNAELDELRRIRNVVRMGRVQALELDRIVLDRGTAATSPGNVHVDCSASAITNLKVKPVFEGSLITPQTVRPYQPVFSASFIAHIEATYDDEKTKNKLCGVVPLPNSDTDYLRFTAASLRNQQLWSREPGLREWLCDNRLDGFSKLVASVREHETDKIEILQRMRRSAGPAAAKLTQFLLELDTPSTQGTAA